MSVIIAARNVVRTYRLGGEDGAVVRALRGVDLEISAGEFVALVGPSGCGKSTLLHLLGLLDVPDEGELEVLGTVVRAGSQVSGNDIAALRRSGLAYIFQSFHLLPGASALENVALPLTYRGVSGAERKRRATEALERVGLGDKLHSTPAQLSGGQQQRVAIARALVVNPSILLADEPTGNLDSTTSKEIVALLRQLHRDMGLTVVIVTHDPDLADNADRCVRLKDGVVDTDTRNVRAQPKANAASASRPTTSSSLLSVLAMTTSSALRSIGRTKLRAGLTLLGVMFGIAAVVVTAALGEGAKQRIEKELTTLGTNLIFVRPGPPPEPDQPRVRLDDGDVEALEEEIRDATAISPVIEDAATVVAGNRSISTRLTGTNLDYLVARGWDVDEGTAWGIDDERRAAKVCLLGRTVADSLFPEGDAVGASVRVGRMPCEVTGILAVKGQNSWGQDQDDTVLLPLVTMRARIVGRGGDYIDSLTIAAEDDKALASIQERTMALLKDRHRIKNDDQIRVRNMAELLGALDAQRSAITMLLLAVAAVSLLVGGIGVMNIMLVSVTERTREVGMRLAIGARRLDIRLQFLVESVVLTIVGGLIGLLLGAGSSQLVSRFTEFQAVWQPESAIVAFVVSAVIGVVFGLLPAERAARLTPSMALRHE